MGLKVALVAVVGALPGGCRKQPVSDRNAPSVAPGKAAVVGAVPTKAAASKPSRAPARTDNMATQPSTVPYPEPVDRAIRAAVAALPADFAPRTRHYDGAEHRSKQRHADPYAPKGSEPNYTNRLILQTSPYLRQHAHNPVDWRPWGQQAFAEARKLDRPIFLSVGYSTCHWCHVMEHESFEDLEIAALLNSRYVPIKVDREERPDVDAIYMAAVHALHGSGGWPMSVWIDPGPGGPGEELHGLPFFAGTYFPARAGARGRRRGFAGLCLELADSFTKDRANLRLKGDAVARRIRSHMAGDSKGPMVGPAATDRLVNQLRDQFDGVHGGTRRAPKFPSNIPHRVLLRAHLRSNDEKAREISLLTLHKMSRGGIYDHVGGGFARYSTDARWLVPHFEKMLYDQALIGRALVDAVVATADPWLTATLRETMDYALREMRHTAADGKPGAFYSATDADSEGEEGLFFVWTPAQLDKVLGPADAKLVAGVYDVTKPGNFEGRNILNLQLSWPELGKRHKSDPEALRRRLRGLLDKLYAHRKGRVPPLRDDKILTSWNGLLIGTLASAGFALAEPRYTRAAGEAADYILTRMRSEDGRLLRSAFADRARFVAYLDDYAFFIAGLLELFEATGQARWLRHALDLQGKLDAHYADTKDGGYFTTAADAPSLLARGKPDYDGAEPSGNSVAALNLVRLWALTGDGGWRGRAMAAIGAFSARLGRWPLAMSELLLAVEMFHWPPREIVIVRPAGTPVSVTEPLLRVLRTTFMPHKVVLQVEQGAGIKALSALTPLVRDKVARGGKPTAYVCVQGTCKLPTTDPKTLRKQLLERPTAPDGAASK